MDSILKLYDDYLVWEHDHYLSSITSDKEEENPHVKKIRDEFNNYGDYSEYNDNIIMIFCHILKNKNNLNTDLLESRFDIYPKHVFIFMHALEPIYPFNLMKNYYDFRELFFGYIQGVIGNLFILNENLQNIIEVNIEYIKNMIKERDEFNLNATI